MWDRARRTSLGIFDDFLIFTFVCMATCDVTAERRNDVMTSVIRWRHYVCRRQTVTAERRNSTQRKQRLQCKTLFCTCWLPQKVHLTPKKEWEHTKILAFSIRRSARYAMVGGNDIFRREMPWWVEMTSFGAKCHGWRKWRLSFVRTWEGRVSSFFSVKQ